MDNPETSTTPSMFTMSATTNMHLLHLGSWLKNRILELLPPNARTEPMQNYADILADFQTVALQGVASGHIAASEHMPPCDSSLRRPPRESAFPYPEDVMQDFYKEYRSIMKFLNLSQRRLLLERLRKREVPKPLPEHWQPVPEDQLAEAKQWGRYCSAAYYYTVDKLQNWICLSNSDGIPHQAKVHRMFYNHDTGACGYLASIEQEDDVEPGPNVKRQIILAFRGTVLPRSWLFNLRAVKIDYDVPDEFQHDFSDTSNRKMKNIISRRPEVHKGFYKVTMSIFEQVIESINRLVAEWRHTGRLTDKTPVELVILGHSLGGAMAILTATEIVARKPKWLPMMKIKVYTFGQPRTGNAAFTRLVHLEEKKGYFSVVRITNTGDIVPFLPPDRIRFRHHGNRWLIREDGTTWRMDPLIRSKLSDEELDAEEGSNLDKYTPFSGVSAHLRAWDILFCEWLHEAEEHKLNKLVDEE